MRLSRRVFTALLFVCAASTLIVNRGDRVSAQAPPAAAMRWDGLIEHITAVSPWGDQQPDGPSQLPRHSISADGRYVIFTSDATNLAGSPGRAIFIRDRDAGTTQYLIGWGKHPALSADGNHVAFEACDPWLRPDGSAVCDVWTFDLRSYMLARMSETSDGTPGDGDSTQPVLSADGRFVAFRTSATNLLSPGATPGQIVVRDRDADGNGVFDEPGTAAIDIISAETGSNSPGTDISESAELSDNGRYVAFRSRAKNFVATTSTADWNVFVRDRLAHETRQVNVRPEGQPSPFSVDSRDISITSDGRYVAFASADPMLAAGVPDDTDAALDVFVYDRDTQWITRIDLTSDGLGGTGDVQSPMFSADGRYVAVVAMSRNESYPPAPRSNLVHVYDRATATSTLVSVRPDGVTPDDRCETAAISADASTVSFTSAATNLAASVTARLDAIYAAVHFDVQPGEVTVPGRGGSATFTVTAQAHTRWWTMWDWTAYWFTPDGIPQGLGNGSFSGRAQEANPDPTPRSTNITFNGVKTVVFTEAAGLSLTSVSPSSGPATGGTVVTLHGTGFEPDTRAEFGGVDASVQFVDSTTLVATTPAGQVGPTWVGVLSSDFRGRFLDNAFRYTDTTPPMIFPSVSGTLGGDGWYTSGVTVDWFTWDQDGPVLERSGCDTASVTTDTPGTTISCSATSEGGTASASTTFKIDATRPTVTVTSPSPLQPIYERNAIVPAAYQCSDALSGVATCGGDVQSGEPIDTSSFGYHQLLAWSGDRAGNLGGVYADYAVSYGFCAPPNPGLKAWWRMESDTVEQMTGSPAMRVNIAQDAFAPAITGRGYVFPARSAGRLDHYHYSALDFSEGMTFAAWVKPTNAGRGILVRHPFQYLVERMGDGSIGFQFAQQDGGVAQSTTAANAPQNVWTHIVVTYANGLVKTYVNGRAVHMYSHPGVLRTPAWQTPLSIGGQDDPGNPKPFVGSLDEVQLFGRALSDDDVESMFLSGSHGLCLAQPTTLDVVSPIHAIHGAGRYHVIAMLRDQSGLPLEGQPITLYQQAYDEAADPMPSVTLTTDASGSVFWDPPFDLAAGTYSGGLLAVFNGNVLHARAEAHADVIVDKAVAAIQWPAPAPITYGTALSSAGQLNATASVPGIFSYSPYPGAVLDAGSHTLNATFYPTDDRNYADASASVPLLVNKAAPNVTIAGGTFTYDGQPHGANASATDYRGLPLTPVTIAYNGLPDVPVAAGSYAAVATYGGDVNHTERSATATITIQKAAPSIVLSSPTTFTYDAQPHGVTAAVYGVGGTSIGSAHVVYAGLTGEPVNAGTYTATVTFDGDANYAPRTISATVTINPAAPTLTVSGGSFVYDKQPHAATVMATGVGGEALTGVTITYDGAADAPVNAGTYAVVAALSASANYTAVSATGSLMITKAAPIVTVTDATFTYGEPHVLSAVATGVGGELLSSSLSTIYNGQPGLIPYDAGTYAAVAAYPGSANYTSATGTGTLTIVQAVPTFVVSGGDVTYTGQPQPALVAVTGVHGETLSTYTVTYNGSSAAPIDAGTYAVHASFAGSANYAPADASNTLVIQRATPTVSASGGAYTYDAQPHPATVRASDIAGQPLPLTVKYNGAAAPPVDAGTYAVEATFAGSLNYAAATATASITINKAVPVVSVTGGTFTYDGQLHPATATVTGVAGESLAPVTFQYWRDGFGYVDPVNAGTYQATALFAGTANYVSRSGSAPLTIAKATPTATWPMPASIVYGTPLGATQLNASSNVAGSFSYSPNFNTVLPAGVGRALSATFLPSDPQNYASVSATTTIDVVRAPLTVRALDSSKPFGAALPPFTATASGFVNGDSMTSLGGTLTFSTPATAASPVGTYAVTPAGLTSSNYAIVFTAGTLTVTPATTAVIVSSSANPSGANQGVTFSASVSVVAGAGNPTGTIEFRDGSTRLGTIALAAGAASLATNGLSTGSHTITAIYSGDPSFAASSQSMTHVVNTSSTSSTVAVTSSANPATSGSTVTLTATLTAPAGATGSVAFYDGAALLGTAALSGTTARLSTSAFAVGAHAITARYLGDTAVPPSISPVFVQDVAASGAHLKTSTMTLVASPSPATLDGQVTFTATVTGSNKIVPTGAVLFMVNGQVIGSASGVTLTATGSVTARAVLNTSTLAHGTHTVTATYLGDANYRGVASTISLTVN